MKLTEMDTKIHAAVCVMYYRVEYTLRCNRHGWRNHSNSQKQQWQKTIGHIA